MNKYIYIYIYQIGLSLFNLKWTIIFIINSLIIIEHETLLIEDTHAYKYR